MLRAGRMARQWARTSGGGSSATVLLRVAFRPHMIFDSDLRYDVLICFGLSLQTSLWQRVFM
jgi:hypothetical protein